MNEWDVFTATASEWAKRTTRERERAEQLRAQRDALLAACKELVEALGDVWYGTPEESEPIDKEEIIARADAAIALAEEGH